MLPPQLLPYGRPSARPHAKQRIVPQEAMQSDRNRALSLRGHAYLGDTMGDVGVDFASEVRVSD